LTTRKRGRWRKNHIWGEEKKAFFPLPQTRVEMRFFENEMKFTPSAGAGKEKDVFFFTSQGFPSSFGTDFGRDPPFFAAIRRHLARPLALMWRSGTMENDGDDSLFSHPRFFLDSSPRRTTALLYGPSLAGKNEQRK